MSRGVFLNVSDWRHRVLWLRLNWEDNSSDQCLKASFLFCWNMHIRNDITLISAQLPKWLSLKEPIRNGEVTVCIQCCRVIFEELEWTGCDKTIIKSDPPPSNQSFFTFPTPVDAVPTTRQICDEACIFKLGVRTGLKMLEFLITEDSLIHFCCECVWCVKESVNAC